MPSLHDTILCYGSNDATFHQVMIPNDNPNTSQYVSAKDASGKTVVKRDKDGNPIKRELRKEIAVGDVWDLPIISPNARERTGYPTQKPLALLERIIKASSNPDSMVLDPFCGCATTLVAADRLQRQWVGIDISEKAVKLVTRRIKDDQGLFENIIPRTDLPQRTDIGKLPPYNCAENRKKLYGEQGGDCNGCGTHFEPRHFEVDHIIAQGSGGTDHIDNLQLLCSNCNRIKGDRGMEYLRAKLQL